MSAQHLEVLETTVQKTHQWIDSLAEAAHLDSHTAYQALRAVLQTLRDRLPAPEAAHFAAQLPLLVRGMFYEGYRPTDVPERLSRQEFLDRISEKILSERLADPVEAASQVFALLERFLGCGELEKIGLVLPMELRSLFPERVKGWPWQIG
jgi:uncharacterized protein (DUF2267 family)